MTDERLYIDGVLVDMGTDTKITLDVKSNLFRDISKIVSNNTYTVKLPKTVRNQMILEHTDLVQSNTDFPYLTHTARYFRNGVEVIRDGSASVLEVTDEAIEVSIVWGLYSNFSSLISKGTTLNQLESTDKILFESKNKPTTYEAAKTADYCYIGLDVMQHETTPDYTFRTSEGQTSPKGGRSWGGGTYGYGVSFGRTGTTADGIANLPPSVRVPFILDLIKKQCGVEFKFTGEAKDYIDTLFVPLISKKSNELTFEGGAFEASLGSITGVISGTVPITITKSTNVFDESSGTVQQLTVAADATMILDLTAEWQFDTSRWSKPSGRGSGGDSWNVRGYHYLDIKITGGGEDTEYKIGDISNMGYTRVSVPTGYRGIVKHEYKAYGKLEVKKGQTITIQWLVYGLGLSGAQFNGGTLNASLSSDENVPSGGYFPISSNLPKIKIIDFVKFLAAITGTFPMQMASDGVVTFIPLSTVWNNKAKAVDWTRRVIPQGGENKPKTIEFKMTDYAQHNYYKWKNDKWVVGSYDGDLQVANETLSTERTILEFPFSATDGNNVPMYKEATSSGTGGNGTFGSGGSSSTTGSGTTTTTTATENGPEYSACTDRILRLGQDSEGNAVGMFDIYMQEIINAKYSEVFTTLQYAKIVKETMRIRDIELLEFDETKPIFLAQYGAYFAVNEIKSEATGLAEVEMLKLEIKD
jgi:hypothetical protein